MDKHLHIVSFDVPYPADYGGVIDVFYRIKWLSAVGFKIHLHCFTKGRPPQPLLKTLCTTVSYYHRIIPWLSLSTQIPYIVKSRKSASLEHVLLEDHYPILLEGIHCSALLLNPAFRDRQILLRQHNVENRYYAKLAQHERNIFKKLYFLAEAALLDKYERLIGGKVQMLPISEQDLQIFTKEYGANNPVILPPFTPWNEVKSKSGLGDYCLYHGNLSVIENDTAARWLIEKVFASLKAKLIIAGKCPSKQLIKLVDQFPHITLVKDPADDVMQELVSEAQVHVLPSFNDTGVKLKVLNALFNGRHCLVNNQAVKGTGSAELCNVAGSADEFVAAIAKLLEQDFTNLDFEKRRKLLLRDYDNENSTRLLSSLIH